MSLLPATTYAAPPRLGRGRPLKTIVEAEECTFGFKSDSEGDDSDRTIIARPAGLDAKLAAGATARSKLSSSSYMTAPSPVASSPCSSIDDGSVQDYSRDSYADSDAGTVFSEDSCPSLAGSNDTTFYTNSSRNSMSSANSVRSSRNRYPSILIPRGSWQEESTIKEMALGMSPAQKIMLSPQALSALPQHFPSLNAPPSFGDGSSMASNSPAMPAISSAPITPDLQNSVSTEAGNWGGVNQSLNVPLEIAVDERHSVLLSPSEVRSQSDRTSVGYSTDWSDMVVRFPEIPGATPQEMTPISPNVHMLKSFRTEPSDHGVQLPTDAMDLLHHLTRSYSPVSESHESTTSKGQVEMKERSEVGADEPENEVACTPTSDYSFSQLSIPSPGGFFSSLQTSSRATWSLPAQPKAPSVPSTAMAATFYDVPFTRPASTIETIVEAPDSAMTDGPPTARQPGFDTPAEYRADEPEEEDEDLYGARSRSPRSALKSSSPEIAHEYEDKYQADLDQAAVANIGRTSDWLSAQNTYLSALRESNPRNDPAEYIPQTPVSQDNEDDQPEESPAKKAVRFLEEAIRMSNPVADDAKKPVRESRPRDPVFLEAFQHCVAQKGRQDVFLQAAARLERINSNRLALPVQHVHALLNTYSTETLQMHSRPKYRGPFSQNPRATGSFANTPEQVIYAEAERKQLAMDHILPAVWSTEAQRRVFYKGGLFASPATSRYLSQRSATSKTVRVLDLAGAATGSWAWAAAQTWPNVSFVTVQTKNQFQTASQWPVSGKNKHNKVVKPSSLDNHRVVTVPELWRLPFADNHFDVISARTLHMFIRSCPVPEMPNINEWDLVLKECMRVLKTGGVFDYVLLDSHVANNSTDNRSNHSRDHSTETAASISPTAAYGQGLKSPPFTSTFGSSTGLLNPTSVNFGRDLKKRGYEADGGCAKMAERLEASGFKSNKSQQVGLPLGRVGPTHDNVMASYEKLEARAPTPASTCTRSTSSAIQRSKIGSVNQANGRSRTPFPPAPRPISEVSSISRIIDQYSNVEAVQGPVGSTADVSDVAGLLGTMMWEEWLVRHRLEILTSKTRQNTEESADPTFEATNLLYGINDMLAAGYEKGACFRTVVGCARKPAKQPVRKPTKKAQQPSVDTYRARAAQRAQVNPGYNGFPSDETPTTAGTASNATPRGNHYYGRGFATPIEYKRYDLSLDTREPGIGALGSPQFTQSAVDRGEVGTIPMMIRIE